MKQVLLESPRAFVLHPSAFIQILERETRLELATLALARRCSTTELLPLSSTVDSSDSTRLVKRASRHAQNTDQSVSLTSVCKWNNLPRNSEESNENPKILRRALDLCCGMPGHRRRCPTGLQETT